MQTSISIILSLVSLFAVLPDAGNAAINDQELYSLASEAASHFRMGNDLMKSDQAAADKEYEMALIRYERMIDEGHIANQYIYYNMGNICLMKNDLGRAILNFRRAELFDKGFADLQKNLNYARSQRIDQISPQAEERILTTLFFWHYDLNNQTKLRIAAIAWFVAWVLGIILVLQGRKPWLAGGLLISVLLVVSFSASLVITHREIKTEEGVLLADQVVARQGDGTNYPESFEQPLHAGTEFVLLESRDDWYHIELLNGDKTWIQAENTGLLRLGPG
jgi:tetratricopeptide (TPR) repeat protein